MLTSSYQAEYGRAIGGQVQVVTKSGTQDFSGSAYWYARRSDWNANTWLNNRSGTALPKSERNDRGYTVGGPIYIPGLFNTQQEQAVLLLEPGVPAPEGPGRRAARDGADRARAEG